MKYNCAKCGRGSEIVKSEDCYFCGGVIPSVEPNEKRYCSHCGVLCREQLLGAENNMMFNSYDKKTGQRNYFYKYTCPNWGEKLWGLIVSLHDNYFIDDVIKI